MRISDWSSDVFSSDLPEVWPELAARRVPHDYSAQPLSSFTTDLDVALDFAREGEGILLAELVPLSAVFSTSLVLGFLGAEVVVRDHRNRWLVPLRRTEGAWVVDRSEEHTSELQSLMRISYAVFCLKKNTTTQTQQITLIRTPILK